MSDRIIVPAQTYNGTITVGSGDTLQVDGPTGYPASKYPGGYVIGAAAMPGVILDGTGSVGTYSSRANLNNAGSITGGSITGASQNPGASNAFANGAGVTVSGYALLYNDDGAVIQGGTATGNGSVAGVGVVIGSVSSSSQNHGSIIGGTFSTTQGGSGTGGIGLLISGAGQISDEEAPAITGGQSFNGAGGTGVVLDSSEGTFYVVASSVTGGQGTTSGGIGIDLEAGSVDGFGFAATGGYGTAVGGDGAKVAADTLSGNSFTGGNSLNLGGDGALVTGGSFGASTITGGDATGANSQGGRGVYVTGGSVDLANGESATGGNGTALGGVGVSLAAAGSLTLENGSTVTGGTGVTGGAGLYVGKGAAPTIDSGATIVGGYGTSFGGAGVYMAPSTNFIAGAGVTIEGGLNAGGVQADSIQFSTKADPSLLLYAGATLDGDIGGFESGDHITLHGVTTYSIGSGVAQADGDTRYEITTTGGSVDLSFYLDVIKGSHLAAGDITVATGACFLRGTRIATASGERAVEALKIGELVRTHSNLLRPIKWIGRRHHRPSEVLGDPTLRPVCFRAGSLGDGLPIRELRVSSEHAMYVDGLLVAAHALINGMGIVRDTDTDEIEYYHIEFDSHDLVLAEGAPAESFADDESRSTFDNAAEYHVLYPDKYQVPARFCAPRIEEGQLLENIRRRLARVPPHVPAELSQLHKVPAYHEISGEVRPHCLVPNGIGDARIAARYEVR